MGTKNTYQEPLDYFLSLSNNILTESKDLLFDLMAETARQENLSPAYKEDRIYLISHLHQLLTGIEKEKNNLSGG
jgi:hypothetical protein